MMDLLEDEWEMFLSNQTQPDKEVLNNEDDNVRDYISDEAWIQLIMIVFVYY